VIAFTHQPISLPGRVPTALGTTGCVGPGADLEALKIEQFFAVARDQHTVPFLSNLQPNHINYTTPPADPQLIAPEIISTDKGHAVTLPLSIVIFHHIPLLICCLDQTCHLMKELSSIIFARASSSVKLLILLTIIWGTYSYITGVLINP
jgi:hypothetical protein